MKSELVQMRVTPEQKRALSAAASAAGLTVTCYLLVRAGLVAADLVADMVLKAQERGSGDHVKSKSDS